MMNDSEVRQLAFNSKFSCRCQTANNSITDYCEMERLNLCRIDLKEHDYLFDKDIENYAKFHSNFDYYTIHSFHKLITNLQNDQHFSIFHTNIQLVGLNMISKLCVLFITILVKDPQNFLNI